LVIHCLIIALTIFVSQNSAVGRNDRVINAFTQTIVACAIVVTLSTAYFIFFGKMTISIFGYDAQILEPANKYLLFYSVTLILVAVNQGLNAVFKGSGDTVIPLAIILLSVFFVKLPASVFELKIFENRQIFIGETLEALSIFVFSLIYFASKFYKNWTLLELKEIE
ncbi:MAG: hypothetical protein HC831_22660, partial [Chloroflexia bacterium]|nr:hypothetical protein [Chloroflexia bacterium]